MTPLSVAWSQVVHNLSRSKHLIHLACRLGIGVSYDEILRIDTGIVQRTIDLCGENRVPIPPSIKPSIVLHAATDNFDRNDKKGGSHDTILMLFQNSDNTDDSFTSTTTSTITSMTTSTATSTTTSTATSTTTSLSTSSSKSKFMAKISSKPQEGKQLRKLTEKLPCQNLIKVNRGRFRGQIPPDYKVNETFDHIGKNDSDFRYQLWLLVRHTADTLTQIDNSNTVIKHSIPSFSAFNSLLSNVKINLTQLAFAPILPYPATDYDAIHTTMINFQDVLKQKEMPYGALWCDEGV